LAIRIGDAPGIAKNSPLGTRVVRELVSDCIPGEHELFFDNFFTSIPLMNELRLKGVRATGTIHDNRVRNVSQLPTVATMKKKPRGTRAAVHNRKNELTLVQWNDNNVVTLATNYDTIYPNKTCHQYCRPAK
jgi:hypothetical protein